ncbi:unnamed protein product [Dovyalis caffra]|uniref:LIM zinc-binding domain-containing protein n=1 Tax=Dovyalis caffra TaxID=77055 RepID=A0AAV1S8M3_9ROSI|nr:unnamed protein product [Dovyalis caffra]
MGNCNATLAFKRSKLTRKQMDSVNHTPHHEGIKTVKVDKVCDFSGNSDLCICIVTWNMNGQVVYEDLVELVGSNSKSDLLVVGLQEVPRKNIAQLLQTALLDSHVLLGKAIMQSLQLYVFGPQNSGLFIKELKVDKHSVGGCGGLIRRKKGAVAICLNYNGIRIVFISCHLSAHARNVEERNSQFRHIYHNLFSKYWNPYGRPAQVTVCLGDLNYRIQGMDTHPMLTSKDQLLQEAERGQVFDGYCEGTLTFKPTYKYDVGSSNYDTSSKVRVPSWTDRILFKIHDVENISASLHSYESIDDIHSSDHKPVKAHLCLKKFVDNEQITIHVMGWLSKIFKGSSHSISEGHFHGNYGQDAHYNAPSTSGVAWLEQENEDIDRAIALSLLEDSHNGKNVIDNEIQVKEDEQLAKALQESLNVESPPRYGNGIPRYGNGIPYQGSAYQPYPVHFPMGFRICAGCNTEIGQGRFLNCLNAFWHPECFRCHACGLPISDYEFSMTGNYPYHKSCYKDRYHPKCEVCKHFIPTNPAGLIEYRAHPFWIQKYCPSHEHDGTPRCCSCERMEPRDTGYIALNDGRKLCLECLDSAVMDTKECQPLYLDIQEFYERLNMKVEQHVPLLLVERQALNEARDGEKHGHYHMPETRGLCLSEEQTISTVSRRPKFGAGNRAMGMITEPYKLTRRCEVTAILILYGLPRLLTGSILAHEMMHAWMRLKGFQTLSQDVEEGICQVLAHMWLESELTSTPGSNVASSSAPRTTKKGTRSPFESKLGEFFKHQIESDTSPVYGDGFRAGQQAVRKYGLERTLGHIRMTGKFPY